MWSVLVADWKHTCWKLKGKEVSCVFPRRSGNERCFRMFSIQCRNALGSWHQMGFDFKLMSEGFNLLVSKVRREPWWLSCHGDKKQIPQKIAGEWRTPKALATSVCKKPVKTGGGKPITLRRASDLGSNLIHRLTEMSKWHKRLQTECETIWGMTAAIRQFPYQTHLQPNKLRDRLK